jgi:hypothetical protein
LVDASRNSRVCGSHQIFSHSISNEVWNSSDCVYKDVGGLDDIGSWAILDP